MGEFWISKKYSPYSKQYYTQSSRLAQPQHVASLRTIAGHDTLMYTLSRDEDCFCIWEMNALSRQPTFWICPSACEEWFMVIVRCNGHISVCRNISHVGWFFLPILDRSPRNTVRLSTSTCQLQFSCKINRFLEDICKLGHNSPVYLWGFVPSIDSFFDLCEIWDVFDEIVPVADCVEERSFFTLCP